MSRCTRRSSLSLRCTGLCGGGNVFSLYNYTQYKPVFLGKDQIETLFTVQDPT